MAQTPDANVFKDHWRAKPLASGKGISSQLVKRAAWPGSNHEWIWTGCATASESSEKQCR